MKARACPDHRSEEDSHQQPWEVCGDGSVCPNLDDLGDMDCIQQTDLPISWGNAGNVIKWGY